MTTCTKGNRAHAITAWNGGVAFVQLKLTTYTGLASCGKLADKSARSVRHRAAVFHILPRKISLHSAIGRQTLLPLVTTRW
jgi:hypothetical protein